VAALVVVAAEVVLVLVAVVEPTAVVAAVAPAAVVPVDVLAAPVVVAAVVAAIVAALVVGPVVLVVSPHAERLSKASRPAITARDIKRLCPCITFFDIKTSFLTPIRNN
jgi:hypothetical protein